MTAMLGVPGGADVEWAALCAAVEDFGPAACESSRAAEVWWEKASQDQAVAVCRSCRVQPECQDYALAAGERFGVWGALTEGERALWRSGSGL